MEFRLFYDGPLKANRGASDKHVLRKHFHVQLRELLGRKGMEHFKRLLEKEDQRATFISLGGFRFAPFITERLHNVARLHVTLLTPEEPGRAITQGGDLDNRLKTLLDALRSPKVANEVPANVAPQENEEPFYCVLEDDALISGLSVTTDRLLRPNESSSNVVLIIHVIPESTHSSLGTATWTFV